MTLELLTRSALYIQYSRLSGPSGPEQIFITPFQKLPDIQKYRKPGIKILTRVFDNEGMWIDDW